MSVLKVRGVCPHDCPDSCGVVSEVENGRILRFYGDSDHPITQGWLCAKVRPYPDHVYHPDRLLYPLRRVGKKGGGIWERISWEDAIGEIGRDGVTLLHGMGLKPFCHTATAVR